MYSLFCSVASVRKVGRTPQERGNGGVEAGLPTL